MMNMSKSKKGTSNKKKGHYKLDTQAMAFMTAYLNTASPVSFEQAGQKVWLDYIAPYTDDYFTDAYGSAAAIVNPELPFKVVIEAHADEISWYVNLITDGGLMYVTRNGGSDHQIAPSMRVNIHGRKGIVKAVFGWPAIHTRKPGTEKEPTPKIETIWLDCGARTKKEVEDLGIQVGSVVTYVDGIDELSHDHLIARAFDNRIGGFMIAEVARMLHEQKIKLPYALFVVNAVQEEIGLRGAEMIARRIKPDVAIVTDVTHDTNTPMINKSIEGEVMCGKGPSLAYAPAVQTKLLGLVEEIAKKKEIDIQWRALSRSTGTDTDSFAYSNEGCPSVLISIPLRYMHTTVEMLHKKDIENTIQLIFETLKELNPKTNLKFFDK